jgi:hypothetical protein
MKIVKLADAIGVNLTRFDHKAARDCCLPGTAVAKPQEVTEKETVGMLRREMLLPRPRPFPAANPTSASQALVVTEGKSGVNGRGVGGGGEGRVME